jgi:hypothetical protein
MLADAFETFVEKVLVEVLLFEEFGGPLEEALGEVGVELSRRLGVEVLDQFH